MLELTLPWPASALNPNARVHWTSAAKATKSAREYAFWVAKQAARHAELPTNDLLLLQFTFHQPTVRHRDDDNLIRMCKPYRDGIADALGINDGRFRTGTPIFSKQIVAGGLVAVRITRYEEPEA